MCLIRIESATRTLNRDCRECRALSVLLRRTNHHLEYLIVADLMEIPGQLVPTLRQVNSEIDVGDYPLDMPLERYSAFYCSDCIV